MPRILCASILFLALSSGTLAKTSRELVTEFVKKSGALTFGRDFEYFSVLIESKESEDYDDHIDEFTKAAEKFEKNVKFVFINTDVEENWQVIEFLGLIAEDVPTVLFISLGKLLKKSKAPFEEITKANIISFTQDCLDGKAEWFLKSDDVPENWDAEPVKVLVGKNFDSVVFGKQKATFVYFYAPWCAACQNMMAEVERLGKLYAKNKDVLIAKCDSTTNEVAHLNVLDVPTIALFLKDDKKAIYYTGKQRTAEAFSEFIVKTINKGGAGDEDSKKAEEVKKEGKKEEQKLKDKKEKKEAKKLDKEEKKESKKETKEKKETKKAEKKDDIKEKSKSKKQEKHSEKDEEKTEKSPDAKKQKKDAVKEKTEKAKSEPEKKKSSKAAKKEKDAKKQEQKDKQKDKDASGKAKTKRSKKEEL